jgi:hypothetical protein
MITMFTMHGASVEPSPEVLTIKEFNDIWEKDSSTSKTKARAAFAYIYHTADPKSNYVNLFDREAQARQDFLQGKAPDKSITKALEKYTSLITTPEQKLLEGALNVASKLAEYFESVDFNEVTSKGELKYDPHKIMGSLSKVGEVIKSLKALRELMEKGQEEKRGNRGDAELNMFDAMDE